MKRFILSLSLLSFSCLMAQGTLDLTSQAMMRRAKMAEKNTLPQDSKIRLLQKEKKFPTAQQPMMAMVKLNDGATAEDLAADGFEVKSLRGGFAIVTCSAHEATRLAAHKSVKKCEFNRQRGFHLDNAREITGVNTLHHGIDLPQTFTGKGVITGIVDGGFDPNHVNFKDAEGKSRFKYFSTVETTTSSIRVIPYNLETLSTFTTDDNYQTHGTHTLGIMAGSFMGEATVGTYSKENGVQVAQMNNPYYGVAYNSSIYASSGASHDALIAYAVDGILDYRWNNDHYTPIVVNLSLGGNQGPHDGSGMLTQYLDAVAVQDNAVICISAGNEGNMPIAYHKTFTEEDNSFSTFIRPYYYSNMRYGIVEFYSDTAEDFEVSVIIYNSARKRVARTFPLNNKDGQIQYICSDEAYQQEETDIVDATFGKAYEGYVGIGGMLDPESGRFYAAIDYYVINSADNPSDENTTEAQYTLGFTVKGKNGQRVDCYCDGAYTALDSYGFDGYVDGMCNGSISDICTGKNTIAVGSFNTKEYAGSIYGMNLGYEGYYKQGEITDFSSFGSLADGRNLPHIVAPGCLVVSSMSTPYYKNPANNISDQITSVKYNDGKRDHYFYPMMGTSMASPFVAGAVALMLEADPSLTYQQVRDILMKTATMDEAVESLDDPVQMGAGKINVLAALKEVLELSSIQKVSDDNSQILFIPTGERSFNIYLPGASHINASLYNLSGARVLEKSGDGNELSLDASSLVPGIYLLSVNGGGKQKIIIR